MIGDLLSLLLVLVEAVESLKCYSCSFSMLEPSPENDDYFCANQTLISMRTESTVRECAPWEKFCLTTVETSLHAFSAIVRDCGDVCRGQCESDGYGTDLVRCDSCCTRDLCNGEYSARFYIALMDTQHTSWIKPLPGERFYNRVIQNSRSAKVLGSQTTIAWIFLIVTLRVATI